MSLKYEVDSIETVDESVRGAYEPVDPDNPEGSYRLKVEGLPQSGGSDKARVREFRDKNIKLLKQNEDLQNQIKTINDKLGGLDFDAVQKLTSQLQRDEDRRLLEESGGDIDKLFEQRVKPIRDRHQQELEQRERKLGEQQRAYEEIRQRYADQRMDIAVQQAVAQAGVQLSSPAALQDVANRCRQAFTLDENFNPVPNDNVIEKYNKNGDVKTLPEYIGQDLLETAPYFFRQPRGGGSRGGSDTNADGVRVVARTQENRLKYAEQIASGKVVLAQR